MHREAFYLAGYLAAFFVDEVDGRLDGGFLENKRLLQVGVEARHPPSG